MTINWGLNRIPDFTQVALAAEDAGRARGKQMRTEAALKAFSANPDEGIALAGTFDPELTDKLTGIRRDRQVQELIPQVLGGQQPAGQQVDGSPQSTLPLPARNGIQINSEALQKLALLDFDKAKQISDFAAKANKDELDRVGEHGKIKAQAAYYLQKFPMGPERDAAFQRMRPKLAQYGFTEEDLAAARLDDQSLKMDQAFGQSVAELADEARIRWVPQGERGLVAFDNMGRPVGDNNPYAGATGGEGGQDDLVAQAEAAIAAGADRAAVYARLGELGGQTQPASGTFPGQ